MTTMTRLDNLPIMVGNKKQAVALVLRYEDSLDITYVWVSYLDGVNNFEWVAANECRPMSGQEFAQLTQGTRLMVPR